MSLVRSVVAVRLSRTGRACVPNRASKIRGPLRIELLARLPGPSLLGARSFVGNRGEQGHENRKGSMESAHVRNGINIRQAAALYTTPYKHSHVRIVSLAVWSKDMTIRTP